LPHLASYAVVVSWEAWFLVRCMAEALADTVVVSVAEALVVSVEAAADSAAAERVGVGNATVVERQCTSDCRSN
jgi:hypothetical protein